MESDGLPARVGRDALGQVALALMLTHHGAEAWADLAVTLAWRLPDMGAALAAGEIDLYRARLIAEFTGVLSQAARTVEKQVLADAGSRTSGDLRARLRRAVITADPDGAERRRRAAERSADVRLYPDHDQTATITASSLPQIESAAGYARITALARARMAAGMPGPLRLHRGQVLLGLIWAPCRLSLPPTARRRMSTRPMTTTPTTAVRVRAPAAAQAMTAALATKAAAAPATTADLATTMPQATAATLATAVVPATTMPQATAVTPATTMPQATTAALATAAVQATAVTLATALVQATAATKATAATAAEQMTCPPRAMRMDTARRRPR